MEHKDVDFDLLKSVLDADYESYVWKTMTDEYLDGLVTFDDVYMDAVDHFIEVAAKCLGTDWEDLYNNHDDVVDLVSGYGKKFTLLVHKKLEEKTDELIDRPFPHEMDEINESVIYAFYRGSIVYGIDPTPKSDVDIVAIVSDYIKLPYAYNDFIYECEDSYVGGSRVIDALLEARPKSFVDLPVHVEYICESDFLKMIIDYHIVALESLWLPEWAWFGEMHDMYLNVFKLDTWKLCQVVSAIVNNSWAKCHKKLTVEKDYDWYRAMKSLFHCFRLYVFATQIARYGKIADYSAANNYWEELFMTPSVPSLKWEDYKEKYQPLLNSVRSEFVKYAPKQK